MKFEAVRWWNRSSEKLKKDWKIVQEIRHKLSVIDWWRKEFNLSERGKKAAAAKFKISPKELKAWLSGEPELRDSYAAKFYCGSASTKYGMSFKLKLLDYLRDHPTERLTDVGEKFGVPSGTVSKWKVNKKALRRQLETKGRLNNPFLLSNGTKDAEASQAESQHDQNSIKHEDTPETHEDTSEVHEDTSSSSSRLDEHATPPIPRSSGKCGETRRDDSSVLVEKVGKHKKRRKLSPLPDQSVDVDHQLTVKPASDDSDIPKNSGSVLANATEKLEDSSNEKYQDAQTKQSKVSARISPPQELGNSLDENYHVQKYKQRVSHDFELKIEVLDYKHAHPGATQAAVACNFGIAPHYVSSWLKHEKTIRAEFAAAAARSQSRPSMVPPPPHHAASPQRTIAAPGAPVRYPLPFKIKVLDYSNDHPKASNADLAHKFDVHSRSIGRWKSQETKLRAEFAANSSQSLSHTRSSPGHHFAPPAGDSNALRGRRPSRTRSDSLSEKVQPHTRRLGPRKSKPADVDDRAGVPSSRSSRGTVSVSMQDSKDIDDNVVSRDTTKLSAQTSDRAKVFENTDSDPKQGAGIGNPPSIAAPAIKKAASGRSAAASSADAGDTRAVVGDAAASSADVDAAADADSSKSRSVEDAAATSEKSSSFISRSAELRRDGAPSDKPSKGDRAAPDGNDSAKSRRKGVVAAKVSAVGGSENPRKGRIGRPLDFRVKVLDYKRGHPHESVPSIAEKFEICGLTLLNWINNEDYIRQSFTEMSKYSIEHKIRVLDYARAHRSMSHANLARHFSMNVEFVGSWKKQEALLREEFKKNQAAKSKSSLAADVRVTTDLRSSAESNSSDGRDLSDETSTTVTRNPHNANVAPIAVAQKNLTSERVPCVPVNLQHVDNGSLLHKGQNGRKAKDASARALETIDGATTVHFLGDKDAAASSSQSSSRKLTPELLARPAVKHTPIGESMERPSAGKSYSLKLKMRVLNFKHANPNVSQNQLARQFSVSASSIGIWRKQEKKLRKAYEESMRIPSAENTSTSSPPASSNSAREPALAITARDAGSETSHGRTSTKRKLGESDTVDAHSTSAVDEGARKRLKWSASALDGVVNLAASAESPKKKQFAAPPAAGASSAANANTPSRWVRRSKRRRRSSLADAMATAAANSVAQHSTAASGDGGGAAISVASPSKSKIRRIGDDKMVRLGHFHITLCFEMPPTPPHTPNV